MAALITRKNKPSVSIVAGMVKITNSGFKNIFNKPKTTATIMACKKSEI